MEKRTNAELPELLSQAELCQYLGKSVAWADRARLEGTGPPYFKIGRTIRYSKQAALDWLKSNERTSTGGSQ